MFIDIIDLTDIDKGFPFTIISWVKSPGQAIKAYLGERRYVMSNPFRMAAVILALSVFFISQSDVFEDVISGFASGVSGEEGNTEDEAIATFNEIVGFMYEYFNVVTFCSIPIMAGISRLFYLRRNYNYAEHLVINTFIIIIQTLVFILAVGVYFISSLNDILLYYMIPSLLYQAYAYASIFESGMIRRVIVATFTTLFQYLVICFLFLIGTMLYLLHTGALG